MIKLIEICESLEKCTEAGWFAYDFHMDGPVDKQTVLLMEPYGSLLLLDMLKEPFFKIESDNWIIKGILGRDYFRAAVHKDSPELISRLEELFI